MFRFIAHRIHVVFFIKFFFGFYLMFSCTVYIIVITSLYIVGAKPLSLQSVLCKLLQYTLYIGIFRECVIRFSIFISRTPW